MKFDFESVLEKAVGDVVRSPEFTNEIHETVKASIGRIVKNMFSDYSPFSKIVAEQLAQAINFDVKELGLHGYNQTVLAIVKQQLDKSIEIAGAKRIKEGMEKLLGETAPAQIKLSELIAQFKDWVATSYSGRRRKIEISIGEIEHGGRWVQLRWIKSYQTDLTHFRIDVQTGEILFVSIGGLNPKESVFAGNLYGFPATMFRLHACGTRVTIDETEFDTDLPPTRGDD